MRERINDDAVAVENHPLVPAVFAPSGVPCRAVPPRDVVGIGDPGHVDRVGPDVDVRARGGETADESGDRSAGRACPLPMACQIPPPT